MSKYKNFFKHCFDNNQYIGLGNPFSNVLFVGKEAGISEVDIEDERNHLTNAENWYLNKQQYSSYKPFVKSKQANYGHTWQKYQRLYSKMCLEPIPDNYEITFIEKVFTSELSNLHAQKSSLATAKTNFKDALIERKELFWKSEFIDKFKIVIISALDTKYIQNHLPQKKEIDDIFNVHYTEEVEFEGNDQKCWLHESNVPHKPKLVIHTRQFTNGGSNGLIDGVANIARNFMTKHQITWLED